MPETTAAATRLIKVLEEATGMPLSMHGDEAAIILDDAGVAEAVEKLEQVLADEESGKGWGPDVTTVGLIREALTALNGTKET